MKLSIDIKTQDEKEDMIEKQEIEKRKQRELSASKRSHEIIEKVVVFLKRNKGKAFSYSEISFYAFGIYYFLFKSTHDFGFIMESAPNVHVKHIEETNYYYYLDSEVAGLNYKMNDLNVICLKSCLQNPPQQMLNCEFNFNGAIKSVVINSCCSVNGIIKMNAWLFETEKPDLFNEKPIGTLHIDSVGTVRANKEETLLYMRIIKQLEKDGEL